MKTRLVRESSRVMIVCSGHIDESAQNELNGLASKLDVTEIAVDCRDISSINSIGISHWMAFWKPLASTKKVSYHNCSLPFLGFLQLIPNKGIELVSGYIKVVCDSCGKEVEFVLDRESVSSEHSCTKCGQVLGLDEELDGLEELFGETS